MCVCLVSVWSKLLRGGNELATEEAELMTDPTTERLMGFGEGRTNAQSEGDGEDEDGDHRHKGLAIIKEGHTAG
ncbi:MAG TPA: hypothetical protein VN622_03625 [Clostridia bacterium]|nr:hypothetical protein [Clostridia bacterium]